MKELSQEWLFSFYAIFAVTIMKEVSFKMNSNLLKIIGLAASIIGAGATLVSDFVNDKKMEEKIDEKVKEALAERDNES